MGRKNRKYDKHFHNNQYQYDNNHQHNDNNNQYINNNEYDNEYNDNGIEGKLWQIRIYKQKTDICT